LNFEVLLWGRFEVSLVRLEEDIMHDVLLDIGTAYSQRVGKEWHKVALTIRVGDASTPVSIRFDTFYHNSSSPYTAALNNVDWAAGNCEDQGEDYCSRMSLLFSYQLAPPIVAAVHDPCWSSSWRMIYVHSLAAVSNLDTVGCNFTEIDQCGYVDISDGPLRWMRGYDHRYRGKVSITQWTIMLECIHV
jgi:hypothetical protein